MKHKAMLPNRDSIPVFKLFAKNLFARNYKFRALSVLYHEIKNPAVVTVELASQLFHLFLFIAHSGSLLNDIKVMSQKLLNFWCKRCSPRQNNLTNKFANCSILNRCVP